MGPEAKLYKKLRKVCKKISWIRIENLSSLGTPDLLGYNTYGTFFTLELKVTKGNKVRFSPHQIAFHKKHKKNTFILVEALGQRSSKLFYLIPGSRISELVACGLRPKLDACGLTLDACCLKLQNLN
jgi:Holliday junction resolvase